MDKIDWSPISKRFWPIPLVVVVAALLILFNAGVWHWLGQATNATAIEGFFAIVQGLFTLALIVLTIFTVRANNEMARANAEMAQQTELMAQETKRMSELQVEQQLAAIRPVLVLRLRKHSHFFGGNMFSTIDRFDIEIANVGPGPALDTTIDYRGRLNYTFEPDEVLPITLAREERVIVRFNLSIDSPFTKIDDPLHWPRTDRDMDLSHQLEDDLTMGRTNTPEHIQRHREYWKRRIQFHSEVTARIADMTSAGRLTVTYRDLLNNNFETAASVVIEDRGEILELGEVEADANPYFLYTGWSPVTLRAISIKWEPEEETYFGEDDDANSVS